MVRVEIICFTGLVLGIFSGVISVLFGGWSWMTWYWIFFVSNLVDAASTSFAMAFLGGDWSEERNSDIQRWGLRWGYSSAMIAHTIILSVVFYVVAWAIVEPFAFWKITRIVIASSLLAWFAISKFIASVHNISH